MRCVHLFPVNLLGVPSSPRQGKMVPGSVFACRIPQKCAICLQVPKATMGMAAALKPKPHLTCALLWWAHRALKSVLASNSICIPVTVVQKRFANVGQFCVDYLTGILAGSVIYASFRTQMWELHGAMAHSFQLLLLWGV